MNAYLLDTIFNPIPRDKNLLLLTESNGTRDSLALNAGVPLWLDDEDAVYGLEVESVSLR
jgi:hypothetical protein